MVSSDFGSAVDYFKHILATANSSSSNKDIFDEDSGLDQHGLEEIPPLEFPPLLFDLDPEVGSKGRNNSVSKNFTFDRLDDFVATFKETLDSTNPVSEGVFWLLGWNYYETDP